MLTTYQINMDLWMPETASPINVVQDDCSSRAIVISLFENGEAWEIPAGIHVQLNYVKSDGTGGVCDSLPDGSAVWKAEENRLTILPVPQMLTAAGPVKLGVELTLGDQVLQTFPIYLNVAKKVASGKGESENYSKVQRFLPLPEEADVGQVLVVSGLTETGSVAGLEGKGYYGITQETGVDSSLVMSQKAVTDALAKVNQTGPEFVNSLDECTDTGKFYVLPDGYLYAYARTNVPQYTNAADTDNADWANDCRLNSSGAAVSQTGTIVTHFIPLALDDVVRIKGLDVRYNYDGGNSNSWRYASGKTVLGNVVNIATMIADGYASIDGDVITVPAGRGNTNEYNSGFAYQRFCGRLMDGYTVDDIVITVNEEIVESQAYAWCCTGREYIPSDYEDRVLALEEASEQNSADVKTLFSQVDALEESVVSAAVPSYWQPYLEKKITTIKKLQETGGKDCFSFAAITDIHESANLGRCSGALARRVMNRCDIKYALGLGDTATRESVTTEKAMYNSFTLAEEILMPIRDRLLQTQGNHDGSWNDDGITFYLNDFTPEKMHSLIYRKVGMVPGVSPDDTGTAYYVDDASNKVRYIMLNSHYAPYEENGDGSAKYSTFHNARFGQAQYDWLISEALNVAAGWAIIVGSHAPLNDDCASYFGGAEGDSVLMRKMLQAYNNRASFSGSFSGTMGYDAVSVKADFRGALGEIIAAVSGHTHIDSDGNFGIPVITVRCDAAEENTAELKAERAAGTTTEQSFDIFTVNRSTRTIHATKIGAGEDRVISY